MQEKDELERNNDMINNEYLLNDLSGIYKFNEKRFKKIDYYHPYIRYLHHKWIKVHEHSWNLLGCTVGLPRTGKSVYTAFSCYLLNYRFNMHRDVVFTAKEFRTRINEITDVGETIVWDEAGVGISARDWYKMQNKEIGKMLQTVGHKCPIIYFVTPDFSFIDSQPKKLFHEFNEVIGRTPEYSMIKPFSLSVDKKKGTIYFKYPKFIYDGYNKMTLIKFYKPPDEFIKQYVEWSDPRKISLRNDSKNLMDKVKRTWDIPSVQTDIMNNIKDFKNKFGMVDGDLVYMFYKDILKASGNPVIQARAIAKAVNMKLNLDRRIKLNENRAAVSEVQAE